MPFIGSLREFFLGTTRRKAATLGSALLGTNALTGTAIHALDSAGHSSAVKDTGHIVRKVSPSPSAIKTSAAPKLSPSSVPHYR
jgi:hypothetical protein